MGQRELNIMTQINSMRENNSWEKTIKNRWERKIMTKNIIENN